MTAKKHDDGKPQLSLMPKAAIEGGARAFGHGVDKYGRYNYRQGEGLDWSRVFDALLRHITTWWHESDNDEESKLNHLDHAQACLAMLMDYQANGLGIDDRPDRESKKVITSIYKPESVPPVSGKISVHCRLPDGHEFRILSGLEDVGIASFLMDQLTVRWPANTYAAVQEGVEVSDGD